MRCQAALGDLPAALDSFTRSVTLNPRALADAHRDRLAVLRLLGRREEFQAGLAIARAAFPDLALPAWDDLPARDVPAPAPVAPAPVPDAKGTSSATPSPARPARPPQAGRNG